MPNLHVLTGAGESPTYPIIRKIGFADLKDAVAKGINRAGLRLVTNRAANLMTRCDKGCCNCAADEAVRAGDEDLHFGSFLT
jgi:hypothetical protein